MNKLHRLWRGKRTDTLEWAEFDVEEAVKVSLETLGQCVGFTDRNCKPSLQILPWYRLQAMVILYQRKNQNGRR